MSTPGQTVGPFYGYALPFDGDAHLVPPGRADAVALHGTVRDGDGAPVPDALLEIRQADAAGRIPVVAGSLHRDGHTFTGWGRAATDGAGRYRFTTVVPGPTAPGGVPFVALTVFARGLLDVLHTRVYLPGTDPDALLARLPEDRRATLVAARDDVGLRFDVVLQGPGETVFLDHP